MKIVFVITDFGGFNNFLGELAKQLIVEQHEVHLICDREKVIAIKDKYPYAALGVRMHHVNFLRRLKIFSWFQTSIKIKKLIKEINPDLVNLHFTSSMFLSLLSGRIPYTSIGVFHGLGYPVLISPVRRQIFKRIELFCFKRLDKICLINNEDYNLVSNMYPKKAYKFHSFGVGCDIHRFNPQRIVEADILEKRNELGISENDFVLMFTGRFVWFKGFDLVIRAFRHLEETGLIPNLKLILAGGKDMAHASGLSEEEETYVSNAKNIIKVGFTSEVEKFLFMSDLFLFPSTKEGMPVAIMESISMGVPVVTLISRGCNDIIVDHENGRLLPKNVGYTQIADAVLQLYNDPKELKKLSEKALQQRKEFDRAYFIEESIALFKNSI